MTGRRTVSVSHWTWRHRALCRDMDSGVFFPPEGEHGTARHRREQAAKAVCARCPVRPQCATDALVNGERHGVWGGLSAAERRAARRTGDRRPHDDEEERTVAWSTRQLAELAGTTVRAVRHYHEVGLLDEPARRANGYKR
ncbi:WhiB family transcriptional regulator [Pseudonocardia nematodicida]|uniref:Transcriptional regulator WhiB n=1 Tax=Pseudonocardia nematodicida TaxID=1206997 RepID=A0ABV1KGS1_9PSEU